MKSLSLTVAIPTRDANGSLLETVTSIRASKGVVVDHILVVADSIEISPKLRASLDALGVELHWNDIPGSYSRKISQLVGLCTTDICIATCDDVLFDKNAIAEIVGTFESNSDVTLVSSALSPLLPARTVTGSVLAQGVRIAARIAQLWRSGDNYLSTSGRGMSFRTTHLKRFRDPENIINYDTFSYFENERLGGAMRYVPSSIVYICPPQTIRDHRGPSNRYRISRNELSNYFESNTISEYQIPFWIRVRAVAEELLLRPMATTLYISLFVYTRIFLKPNAESYNPFWIVERSTKNI